MASASSGRRRELRTGEQAVDYPDDREYADPELQALDEALEEALERAEAADHEYLAHLLRCEIGSLYYEDKLGV